MVKVADIECLFKRYLEENRFECADALYLCAKLGKERAAETLRIRYKMAAPLTSVLEDLKQLGVNNPESYSHTEDTGEIIRHVIIRSFESICLGKFIEDVEKKSKSLSTIAREVLYLAFKLGDFFKYLSLEGLLRIHKLIFQREMNARSLKIALEELIACGVFQSTDWNDMIPDFFDLLIPRLKNILPKIEVNVNWPETM